MFIRSVVVKSVSLFCCCSACGGTTGGVTADVSGGNEIAAVFLALSSNGRIVVPAGQKSGANKRSSSESIDDTLNEMNDSSSKERPRGASDATETSSDSIAMPSLFAT